jgi:ElaB/YqjD/DUF883 family membrane-anchored ribosome-binding protein
MSARSNSTTRKRTQADADALPHDAHELAAQLQECVDELRETARQQASNWERELVEHVRENPLRSVLIAAGVGIAVGVLWRR